MITNLSSSHLKIWFTVSLGKEWPKEVGGHSRYLMNWAIVITKFIIIQNHYYYHNYYHYLVLLSLLLQWLLSSFYCGRFQHNTKHEILKEGQEYRAGSGGDRGNTAGHHRHHWPHWPAKITIMKHHRLWKLTAQGLGCLPLHCYLLHLFLRDMRQREWLKVKQTWQGQLSHKIPALRFRIIFHPELKVEFDIYKVLPTCDPMPVLQLVEGQLQDSHELAIQTQPGTRLEWLCPEFHCSPPRVRELPCQQWDWCPPLYPSAGHSSRRSPGNSQSHCLPVTQLILAAVEIETQRPPQVQIRLVPCFLTVEHSLLCNASVVSFKSKSRSTCMCKDHQGRPKSLRRIPTKEQLQVPCLPVPVTHLRPVDNGLQKTVWDKMLKCIGNCGHQKRR